MTAYIVSIDFAADGETDHFSFTVTAATEDDAFEAACDALTEEYGAPDDILGSTVRAA